MNLDMYIWKLYATPDNPAGLNLEKPKADDWTCYYLRELSWIEYDRIQKECMRPTKESGGRMNWHPDIQAGMKDQVEWTIDKIKMQRMLLLEALYKVERANGEVAQDPMSCINIPVADALYAFYNAKCILNENEVLELERQVELYMNPKSVSRVKPPYNRMIIVLDLLRRGLATLGLEELVSLSKKDLDTLYLLGRLGFDWQPDKIANQPVTSGGNVDPSRFNLGQDVFSASDAEKQMLQHQRQARIQELAEKS